MKERELLGVMAAIIYGTYSRQPGASVRIARELLEIINGNRDTAEVPDERDASS